jgi:Tol biopolymer transport system component
MRHLTLATIAVLAVGLAPASAGPTVRQPMLVFASLHSIQGERSPETVADLFLLRGSVVVRRLTRTPLWEEGPAWSRDGSRLAFSRGPPFCYSFSCWEGPNDLTIWVRNLSSGRAHRITSTQGCFDFSPTWSPDGETIAFARSACEVSGIFTVAPDGQGLELVLRAGAIAALDWSPRSSAIAFVRSGVGVGILDTDTADVTLLRVAGLPVGRTDLAWSPAGDKLAIATRAGVYVLSAQGGRARRVVAGIRAGGVSWSPDGGRLAFSTANRPGRGVWSDIFVVRVNGRGLKRLTTNSGPDFDPQWQP